MSEQTQETRVAIKKQEPMPPSDLTPAEAEKWWKDQLKKEGQGGKIQILSDFERACPHCGAVNACTGIDECVQCSHSLEKAKRLKKDHRHTPEYY